MLNLFYKTENIEIGGKGKDTERLGGASAKEPRDKLVFHVAYLKNSTPLPYINTFFHFSHPIR